MIQRMIGASFFNAETYEDIEADPSAIGQAILVVLLVTICGAVGGVIDGLMGDTSALLIILGVVFGLARGILFWAIWVSLLSLVGGMMLRTGSTQTSWAEMGRVVGFSFTPGVLTIFSFVPFIGGLFPWVAFIWTVAAVVMAVRQALDFESTGRAIAVVIVSAIIAIIPFIIIFALIILWVVLAGVDIEAASGLLTLVGLV